MKKLISLIASLSIMATMVTTVSAAEIANNAPVVETTVVELTKTQFEEEWVGETLPDGQKAYLVDVNVTGLDLENACSGTTNVLKKKRTGVLLMAAGYDIIFDSTENIGAVYTMDGIAGGSSVEKTVKAAFLATKATEGYPTIADGAAAAPATDVFVYQFVITTSGTVTGTVKCELKVSSFDKDSQTGTQTFYATDVDYTVDGVETSTITFGSVTPPPPVQDIIVANKMTLPSGLSWDVTINNYAPAKTYTATFTATGEADKVHDLNFSAVAEATEGASFGFAALLKLKTEKTNVELAVTKN